MVVGVVVTEDDVDVVGDSSPSAARRRVNDGE